MEKHLSNFIDISESILGITLIISIATISAYGLVIFNPKAEVIPQAQVAGISTSQNTNALEYRLLYKVNNHHLNRSASENKDIITITTKHLDQGFFQYEFIQIDNLQTNPKYFDIKANVKGDTGLDLGIFIQDSEGKIYSLDFNKTIKVEIPPQSNGEFNLMYEVKNKINYPIEIIFEISPANL